MLFAEDLTGEGHANRELPGPREGLILPVPDDFDIRRWAKTGPEPPTLLLLDSHFFDDLRKFLSVSFDDPLEFLLSAAEHIKTLVPKALVGIA